MDQYISPTLGTALNFLGRIVLELDLPCFAFVVLPFVIWDSQP
jgi:hypothetical protein